MRLHILPMSIMLKENTALVRTYFMQKLYFDNRIPGGEYFINYDEGFKYWNVSDTDNIIMIPTNLNNNHWVIIIIDCEQKLIIYRDSLGGNSGNYGLQYLMVIEKFIKERGNAHLKAIDQILLSNREIYEVEDTSKSQNNAYNCGVRICRYAELHLTRTNWQILNIMLFRK